MVNSFSKEIQVAFEQPLERFEDALVISKTVDKYLPNGQAMERSNDVVWRPVPYIANTRDRVIGTPVQAQARVQLSVPTTLGFQKVDAFSMDGKELRDSLQKGRLGDASLQALAAAINQSVWDIAASQGQLVVTRTTAPGTFDDVALCETIMNETGVPMNERVMIFNTRDYNGMAGNLANRANLVAGKTQTAYERALIGDNVAGFQAFKSDTSRRIRSASAATGITMDTRASAGNFYVPRATSVSGAGEITNIDNRYQLITVSSTASVAAGDCFTVAGVTFVHQINKQDTGQPYTGRVIEVVNGTTLRVSMPMVTAQGGTAAELQYQNCVVSGAGSASAAVTFINYDATGYNVFFHRPAIELVPARYVVPDNAGANVMTYTTENGIEILMTEKFDPSTLVTTYTVDAFWGVVMNNPAMAGVLLFNQTP